MGDRIEAASAEAARAVAADMPEEEVEGIFGCNMNDARGEEMYAAWKVIIQRSRVSQEAIATELTNGTLPKAFGRWLREIPTKDHVLSSLKLATNPKLQLE